MSNYDTDSIIDPCGAGALARGCLPRRSMLEQNGTATSPKERNLIAQHVSAGIARNGTESRRDATIKQIGSRMKTTGKLFLLALLVITAVSCNNKPTASASQAHSKKFHLKGKVVSVDDRAKMLNVDSEAIPGFMDAMTMPYRIKPESELHQLHAGDAITADLLVQDEGAWLENISVIGHSPAGQKK